MKDQYNIVVSIIVAVYNVESYIEKCLQSIMNQTYPYLEIILVDDGSTDSSGRLCDYYASLDKRIKVLHQHNCGVSRARQVGLNNALGEYLIYADPDDYLELNMIECLLGVALDLNVDMVTTDFYRGEQKVCQKYVDSKDMLRGLLEYRLMFCCWNCFVRRDYLVQNNISFTPDWLCNGEDVLFLVRILVTGAKSTHICIPLYHYEMRQGSLISKGSNIKYLSQKTMVSEIEKLVDASAYDGLFYYKRNVLISAYIGRHFTDINKLYPEIHERMISQKNESPYSIDSLLARCMISSPILVWIDSQIHKVITSVLKRIGKL